MKSFETIIEQEKKATYTQRNKQLFSFYTLTLIAQEQAAKRLRRKLLISRQVYYRWCCFLYWIDPISYPHPSINL